MSRSKIEKTSVGYKIGKYIKYQREKRALSLSELAHSLGFAPSFLMRLEKGIYQTVKFDVIEKISRGLNMEVEDFLRKCEIIPLSFKYPPLEFYLKEMFQLPIEAIADVKMFIDFIKIKYKEEIKKQEQAHKAYWKK